MVFRMVNESSSSRSRLSSTRLRLPAGYASYSAAQADERSYRTSLGFSGQWIKGKSGRAADIRLTLRFVSSSKLKGRFAHFAELKRKWPVG